jgi:hypothetical protein
VLRGSAWRSVDFVSPHFLLFVRQRRSADIAVNKLSVPKRTGKFSTWSNDAATQQVVANGERHGKVENQLVQHHLDISMAPQNCRTLHAYHCSVMVRISVAELI